MKNKINVLWIDDESKKEEYKIYYTEASEYGINLISFQYEEEGLAELSDNFGRYDVVLLDVITQQYKGGPQMENHMKIFERLKDIFHKQRTEIPYFIFTGKSGIGEGAEHVKQIYENQRELFFVKTKDDDRLWAAIKEKVLNEKRFKFKEKYDSILDCAKSFNNDKIFNRITTIIYDIEDYISIIKPWSEMRQLLDDLMYIVVEKNNTALFKKYLINQTDGRVVLTTASLFLEGSFMLDRKSLDSRIKHDDQWDKYITHMMKNFVPILQALNHSIDEETLTNKKKAIWESHRKNKFLKRSVALQLFLLIEYISKRYFHN